MQPQIPRQGVMQAGPQMMGPGFGGRGPMMGMNRAPRSPMMGGAQQMNRGGGLFSKLLGMGNQSGRMGGLMGMQQAGRAAGAGGSMFGNSGGIMGFLNNTQQVLKTAQSIGPMVQQFQQYGSLVKNIPAMWKLYRGLKNAPDASEEKAKSSSKSSKAKTGSNTNPNHSSKLSSSQESSQHKDESSSENKQKTAVHSQQRKDGKGTKRTTSSANKKGASIPKLYI
jgi:hypothetical protein